MPAKPSDARVAAPAKHKAPGSPSDEGNPAMRSPLSQSTRTKLAKLAEQEDAKTFCRLCERFGLPVPMLEYQFHPVRGWQFDFAWPETAIALEVQGGIYSEGRHTRGAALEMEYEKLSEAAALGWRCLFTTPAKLRDLTTFRRLARAMNKELKI